MQVNHVPVQNFQRRKSIGTASANSAKFRGIRPQMYIEDVLKFDNAGDNLTLTLYNGILTSQKPWKHNKKFDCSKTNGLNEVYVFSIKYHYIAIFY